MSEQLIKFGFVAGEVSPTYYGRSDLEKFDLALAEANNWLVDYRGGLITRPGFKFCDYLQSGSVQSPGGFDDFSALSTKVRFFEFNFNNTIANSYVVVAGFNNFRFIQDEAYVLESSKVITGISQANPGVITIVGHGYISNDLVKLVDIVGMTELNGRTIMVKLLAANTFEIYTPNGFPINTTAYTTYVSGGTASKVYSVINSFTISDLEKLRVVQIQDTLRFIHPNFFPQDLKRITHTSWTFGVADFSVNVSPPAGLVLTPSAAGAAGVAFAVTAVDREGNESRASDYVFERATVNYTVTAGSMKLFWTRKNNIAYYNVYRSLLASVGASITRANQLGFLGRALGPDFVDTNIIPDFATPPPKHYDPFRPLRITHVDVTAVGAGYTEATVIGATDGGGTGTGFVAFPILTSGGGISAIVIVDEGGNYSGAVTITATVGAGATFTAKKSGSSPYPYVGCLSQQRLLFGSSNDFPVRIIGSRPGRYNNFDFSDIVTAQDSFEFDLDSDEQSPIRHLLATRFGVLVMTKKGIWLLNGGSDPLNALTAEATQQVYVGASELPPLRIGTDFLYIEDKTATVRLLIYNDINKSFGGVDTSILAQHLIASEQNVDSWGYAANPHRIVALVRRGGGMLFHTIIREQNVFAWTRASTKGYFREVIAVQEGSTDRLYVLVERVVDGITSFFIESAVMRKKVDLEDAFCVDSGLSLPIVKNVNTLTFAAASGSNVTATCDAAIFSDPASIGDVIRALGGKAVIISVTSPTVVQVNIIVPLTETLPEDTTVILVADANDWTIDRPVTVLGGLWHLEGQSVMVLGDGKVMGPFTVALGKVTLAVGVTRATVGLKFTCIAKTLPISSSEVTIDDKRKRVVGVNVRRYESKGLKIGRELTRLYSTRQKTATTMGPAADTLSGEAVPLESVNEYLSIDPKWEPDGQFYIVQDTPQPSTVLGLVLDMELGDDKD